MKSTGEVMGLDMDFGRAYAKSQMAADCNLPLTGSVFVSVRDKDKMPMVPIAKTFSDGLQNHGYAEERPPYSQKTTSP